MTGKVIYAALESDPLAADACLRLQAGCGANIHLLERPVGIGEDYVVFCTLEGEYPGPGGYVKELTPKSRDRGFSPPEWVAAASVAYAIRPEIETNDPLVVEGYEAALRGIHMRLTPWRPSRKSTRRAFKYAGAQRRDRRELLDC